MTQPLRKVEVKRLFREAARDYPPRTELAFLLQSLDSPLNVGSFPNPLEIFGVADRLGTIEVGKFAAKHWNPVFD